MGALSAMRPFRRAARVAGILLVLGLVRPVGAGAQAVEELTTAPVEVDGATLFEVRGVSSLPAGERAALIARQLIAVAADRSIPIESLRVVEDESASRILAGSRLIVALVDADAALEQVQRRALADAHLFRIRHAIADYREARTAPALRRALLRAAVATAVLWLAALVIVRLARKADGLLAARARGLPQTRIQALDFLGAGQAWELLRGTLAAARTLALLTLGLAYAGYLLGLLPWTRALAGQVSGFVLRPLMLLSTAAAASLPDLAFLAVLFVVVRLAVRVLRLFFAAVESGRVRLASFDTEWAQPTYKVVRLILVAFGLIVAFPYIPGSESAAFRGVSIFFGILFSLGSTSAIANVVAGYALIYRRAFKVGDRIRVGDTIGDVTEMRLQVTHLRSIKNEEVILPNSELMASEVLNYSTRAGTEGLILHTDVGVGYSTSWHRVETLLLEAAGRMSIVEPAGRPYVLVKALGQFAVTYELNVFCREVKRMGRLYSEMHRHILDVFNEHEIQIMTPAYQGDPDKPKLADSGWRAGPAAPG